MVVGLKGLFKNFPDTPMPTYTLHLVRRFRPNLIRLLLLLFYDTIVYMARAQNITHFLNSFGFVYPALSLQLSEFRMNHKIKTGDYIIGRTCIQYFFEHNVDFCIHACFYDKSIDFFFKCPLKPQYSHTLDLMRNTGPRIF